MKIKIHTQLCDRRGNPTTPPTTLGEAIVSIIDTTSVAGIQATGNPRLLARVAERIDVQVLSASKPADGEHTVAVNPEEEKALRSAIMTATNLQYFYHRRLLALLWPDTLEDDERAVLLGENPPAPAGNGKASKDSQPAN